MNKNNTYGSGVTYSKGFTLIELLAVIVILAIIALIATPIVLDIINDSKESSKKRSQELFIDGLTQEIARRQLNSVTLSDGVYSVGELDVPVKGDVPEDGYVYIKNGNIVNYYFSYKDGTINESSNSLELEKDILSNTDPFSISAVTLSLGSKLEENFYVKKAEMDKYKNVYILIENDKRQNANDPVKIELKDYKEKDGYYVFSSSSTSFSEFTNIQTITLIGTNNNEEKKTKIKYNISDYIKNVTYNENTSEKSKKLLVALANFGSATQTFFSYNTTATETNLGLVTNVLKEEDRSTDNVISDEGQNILNNIGTLGPITDNTLTEISGSAQSAGIGRTVYLSFRINFNLSPIEDQINNSGMLLFSKESYDRMMTNAINYNLMTIDSKYLKKDFNINKISDKYRIMTVENKNYMYLYYDLDLNNLTQQVYYRFYYKDGKNYKYGNIGTVSILSLIKEKLNDSSKQELKNMFTSLLNFIAVLQNEL